ncbi:MAG: hypothetical protein D6681_21110 [Calditrichaeota bacterium]|nr:MAG: hypothetical protein D6681_21110 [Calditrichota bacterium]
MIIDASCDIGYEITRKLLKNRSLTFRSCSHIGRSRCPKKHFKCMREITPGQVFEIVGAFIS